LPCWQVNRSGRRHDRPGLSLERRIAARQDKFMRRYHAVELRRRGVSLRAIAREVGASAVTVLRDLRQDPLWQEIKG